MEPFHATDCEGQHGQYSQWPKSECDKLMEALVTVLCETELHGYGSVVPIAKYVSIFPDAGEYDPYLLAVRQALINMAHIGLAEQDKYLVGSGMGCCFERGNSDSHIRKIFDELRGVTSWKASGCLKTIEFGTKAMPQLQAADLIAREAYKFLRDGWSSPLLT